MNRYSYFVLISALFVATATQPITAFANVDEEDQITISNSASEDARAINAQIRSNHDSLPSTLNYYTCTFVSTYYDETICAIDGTRKVEVILTASGFNKEALVSKLRDAFNKYGTVSTERAKIFCAVVPMRDIALPEQQPNLPAELETRK